MAQAEPIEDAMRYIREHGIVRPRELEAIGVPRVYLSRLIQQGKIIRLGRGIYSLPDAAVTELHSYAEVTATRRRDDRAEAPCAPSGCARPQEFL